MPRKLSPDPSDQETTISYTQPNLPDPDWQATYTIPPFPTQVEQQVLCMGEDTALVHRTIEEFRYDRVVAPSDDPSIRAIPAE